jgi:hypothetical protein
MNEDEQFERSRETITATSPSRPSWHWEEPGRRKRILLLASHAVAEYDDIRMFHDLGYEVFAPGGYERPSQSGEGIRPALPQVPEYPELVAACNRQREQGGDPGHWIDWAKANIADEVIDWADVIIAHHFVDRWVGAQWDRIKHKRVIWRTCGQSNPTLEESMTPLVKDGLQVVRYSPAEQRHFERHGAFAGQDALIRFGKYPQDFRQWRGNDPVIGNITQHMAQRGDACGYNFWMSATAGLPATPAGPGSEVLAGGLGGLTYDRMLDYLARIRAYLYTGTTPASYTLGLIEAMMTGTPVVSIGPKAWGYGWDGDDLFEVIAKPGFDHPLRARDTLVELLTDPVMANDLSNSQRALAIETFGIGKVGVQWQDFLG